MYEWSVASEPFELPAGEYTVQLVNAGKRVHSIAISGPGVDTESRRLAPSASTTFRVTLAKGEYTVWCPIGDHREDGMLDYLTVR